MLLTITPIDVILVLVIYHYLPRLKVGQEPSLSELGFLILA